VPPDGVLCSIAFPSLWLNVQALLDGTMWQVVETLTRGMASREHEEFVRQLAHT
jgi:hypothetical protein